MINRKTVFIVGAGASFDYKFPLGSGLRSEIAALMAHESDPPFRFVDPDIEEAVAQAVDERGKGEFSRDRMSQAATSIVNGINEVSSIDAFIETRQDEAIEILGKIAIARQILWHERESVLWKVARQNRYSDPVEVASAQKAISNAWINMLGEIIFDRHTRGSLDKVFANCCFIVFNYDRCLEVALARSIEMRFGVSVSKAQQLVEQARIYHPYGRVGDPFIKSENHVRFGYQLANDLYEISKLIRTYSETVETLQSVNIKKALAQAQDIVFLGFGFASQNMQLMATDNPSRVERFFLTVKGFSPGDILAVNNRVGAMMQNQLPGFVNNVTYFSEDTTCREYLTSCRMRLSAA